ncbi:MAG TPA: hypothetical protein VF523_09135 [Burkholderiales bacterium]|uniref:hypothetical protein n=1 Tax=Sphingobium sp. TaxID=1912891 RepID=UPI002ED02F2A
MWVIESFAVWLRYSALIAHYDNDTPLPARLTVIAQRHHPVGVPLIDAAPRSVIGPS